MTDPTRIIVLGIVTVMILGVVVAPFVVMDVIAISVPGVS